MTEKIRLLLIEDNSLLREGIVAMLNNRASMNINAVAGRKDQVDQGVTLFKPHVILLNFGLHSQDSLQLMKEITRKDPGAKILVMDLSPTRKDIIQCLEAGATGFILKDATPQEFVTTIHAVGRGEVVIPGLSRDLLLPQIVEHAVGRGKIDPENSVQFTKFELQLLELINEGLNDREIGEKLEIPSESVKAHIHNIKQNLSLLELIHSISSNSQPGDDE